MELHGKLRAWQNITNDPWICSPGSVLEQNGRFPPYRCVFVNAQWCLIVKVGKFLGTSSLMLVYFCSTINVLYILKRPQVELFLS